jgi:hypothetical protein
MAERVRVREIDDDEGQDPGREPRPRMRATYHRDDGVRHLLAVYNLTEDRLYGHVKARKKRTQFLEFYLRSLHADKQFLAEPH